MYGAVCWSISQLVNDWTRSILQFWYNISLSLQDISSLCYVVASTCCLFWYFKSRRYEVFWTSFFFIYRYRLRYAYDILIDDNKRRDYDKWLHSGLRVSYKGWLEKQKSGHFAMHFAASSKGPLMITEIGNLRFLCFFIFTPQSTFTCSKLTTETLEQSVKYVQN